MSHPIPNSALDDRLGFIGTAGSGKTYNSGGAVERLLEKQARVVIIDPLGVWWGLRLSADGKHPSPFNVAIFGGPHGDLPLNEHAGALIGETAATMAESCIIDLRELGSKASERRFMMAFLETIYRKAGGEPFHLIVDEADLFAPQKPSSGDETLLGHMENIVRRGRVKGFIPWLISQRPAVLNKNVLSQVDGLIAFKLTATQDRDALDAWIEGQADKAQGKEIKDALPAMQVGQGVVWLPGHGILKTAQFPAKITFDSSRTPKRGEKLKRTATLKPLDLGALKERLATVVAETKANDPRELKAKVARLEAELKSAPKNLQNMTDPKAIERAEQQGYARGKIDGYAEAIGGVTAEFSGVIGALDKIGEQFKSIRAAAAQVEHWAKRTKPSMSTMPISASRIAPNVSSQKTPSAKLVIHSGNGSLPPGERAILTAALQYSGVDRDQLSVLTGYKRSSRDAYIQRLREKGFVDLSGSTVVPTPAGTAALPDYAPLPTGQDLQNYWQQRLPEGERKILAELIAAYPNPIERAVLDDATGYKRSSRDAYLQRLKARRLVITQGSSIVASETLF